MPDQTDQQLAASPDGVPSGEALRDLAAAVLAAARDRTTLLTTVDDADLVNSPVEVSPPNMEFEPLAAEDRKNDLATLIRCRTLLEADMIVARLESANIPAFIPDEFLMQAISWNVNTYGYVRVQVSPDDYDAAKEFLSASKAQE